MLDPFFGSGTTGAVAKRLARTFVGIERDETYAKAARARIASVEPLPADVLAAAPSKRSEPRIAFSALVEAGLIRAGETLVDAKQRHSALVRADGTLALGAIIGSIHKVGALAQGLPACNGWTFWHCQRDGKYEPIDFLRANVRENLRTSPPSRTPRQIDLERDAAQNRPHFCSSRSCVTVFHKTNQHLVEFLRDDLRKMVWRVHDDVPAAPERRRTFSRRIESLAPAAGDDKQGYA